MHSFPQFTHSIRWGEFAWVGAIIFKGNFMVNGQFSGRQFSSGAIVKGVGNFTQWQLPGRQLSGGNHPGGNCPGRNNLGDNFPRGQLSGHPFKIIYCFQNSLKLIKIFSSVSENNTVVNIILQTIKGSRKNWGIIFFVLSLNILTRKNGVFLNSVQEFIEIEEWLLLTFSKCLQNQLNAIYSIVTC